MNAKISLIVICAEAIIYLGQSIQEWSQIYLPQILFLPLVNTLSHPLLYNIHDCNFKSNFNHESTERRREKFFLLKFLYIITGSSHRKYSMKRDVLKSFAEVLRKHLCRGLTTLSKKRL